MLIFWVTMRPHSGRIVTQGDIANKIKIEGDKPTFNPYFYVPKYHSSDALPAPKIFTWFLYRRRPTQKKWIKISKKIQPHVFFPASSPSFHQFQKTVPQIPRRLRNQAHRRQSTWRHALFYERIIVVTFICTISLAYGKKKRSRDQIISVVKLKGKKSTLPEEFTWFWRNSV